MDSGRLTEMVLPWYNWNKAGIVKWDNTQEIAIKDECVTCHKIYGLFESHAKYASFYNSQISTQ